MALLILCYVLICCLSCIYVTQLFPAFRMTYDPARLFDAGLAVAAFTPVLLLFTFARFSFGYFVGFYFSSMFAGYLWLSFFSDYTYDHRTALLSAVASAVVFLLAALFITAPIRQIGTMSLRTFDRLLTLIFLFCLATVAVGASYNFRIVNPGDVSNLRADSFPTILNYLIGITSTSLLPFLFACFLARRDFWRAGAVLVLLLFYYPIAMSKVAFFAPVWLVAMASLSRIAGAKVTVILSVLIPTLVGVILIFLFNEHATLSEIVISYFKIVNFRMIAIPSVAMDLYNDFFSKHELTHFCQMWFLKPVISCPYQHPLSIVMFNNYPFGGNFNASLFATEGVASVGLLLAPVSALACGLVVAFGNRLSAGLPPSFILVSGAILAQIMLNVPLTTVLLSHGAGLLFLLWYITPRSMFQDDDSDVWRAGRLLSRVTCLLTCRADAKLPTVCAVPREDCIVEVASLNIAEVKLVVPQIHRDARGFFSETWSRRALEAAGIAAEFVQDNHSLSIEAGTVRGLHFQAPPHAQGKLLRVVRGSVFDVAVDIRVGSPTYGQHVSAILSAENGRQIWIPAGFAHGYCTLEPNTEVIYKVTDYYAPECDRGLQWDDATLGIRWPVDPAGVRLSDKDRKQPALKEMAPAFVFEP